MQSPLNPLSLEDGPQVFRQHLADRGFAAKTQVSYAGDVAGLVSYLRRRTVVDCWDEVALRHLHGFLAGLDHRKLTASTRHRKAIALRSFFAFLHDAGTVAGNASLKLVPPQPDDRDPLVLTRPECKRLVEAAEDDVRDAAILALLLETGMRLAEVVALRLDDLTLSGVDAAGSHVAGTVHIAGKAHQNRTLTISDALCNALEAYLAQRPPAYDSTLFLTKFGRPMNPRAVERLVAKYLARAGILSATVHTLRHTFAVKQVRAGVAIETLQALLGHQSSKFTERYIDMAEVMRLRELQDRTR